MRAERGCEREREKVKDYRNDAVRCVVYSLARWRQKL
jgi:hypothetical protein